MWGDKLNFLPQKGKCKKSHCSSGDTYDAFARLLGGSGRQPRLVDEFVWHLGQLWNVFPDEGSVRVSLFEKGDWAVAPEELKKKRNIFKI